MNSGNRADLDRLIEVIRGRKLVEPAIFMLEMSKPLAGCVREVYRMSSPLIGLFWNSPLAPVIEKVFESSESVESFIQRLEAVGSRPRCAEVRCDGL